MRRVIIFLTILTTAFVISTETLDHEETKINGLAFMINNLLPSALKTITSKNYTLVKPTGLVVPKIFHFLAEGSLNLTDDLKIWGLYNTNTSVLNGYAAGTDEDNKTSLWIDLPISEVGIALGYDADLSIINKIPLYGKGDIVIALSKVDFNLTLNIISPAYPNYLVNMSVRDVDFKKLAIHPSHSYITGFWNNPEADDLVSGIINLVEDVITLFLAAEKDCLICILDPIIEYIVNSVLKQDSSITIDCPCLKEAQGDIYQLERAIEDAVNTFFDGDYERVFQQLLNKDILHFYTNLLEKFYDYAEKQGLIREFKKKYDLL